MKKHYLWGLLLTLSGISFGGYAQEMAIAESSEITFLTEAVNTQKKGLVASLDSLKKLPYNDALHNNEDSLIYQRMRTIQKTVPLAYNEKIKFFIDKYVSQNYNPYMSKLQGLSQYYFPIFEEILKANHLPDEVKYLSVVESSLDPHLVSRSGAVGLWQFMYGTAKIYDLTMDRNVDERKDPYAACHAASRYFMDAYAEFNDWLLALASYNCGRGAVRRAIQRSGLTNPSFWELSPFLPQETQNYIPKFIAMTYALKYADQYGIGTAGVGFDWEAKTIMVDRNVDLKRIAQAVNLSLEEVKKFNPSYKSAVIAATSDRPKRLILPQTQNLNDSLLYAALHHIDAAPVVYAATESSDKPSTGSDKTYKVKPNETLSTVANRFGTTVQNLKAWNNLTSKSRIAGRTLIVKNEEVSRLASVPKKNNQSSGPRFQSYVVRKGDTLSDIANKFKGTTVTHLKNDNGLKGSSLQIGQKLKVRTL
ncbi:lytic transglycosylase domain-containing protein [Sphingobacterium psychroaquaticum]|uniref:Membrane-bound lytic murein transglycosylase D n=1 Tax=Sphingobacterium psychroaquaticum TaxID=561061 RepID=A0A1X7L6W1_9SPHI|nr:lytic transglycosylase domain-containing protein [Sphingobacterium psychroaquaticum]SMG48869.1 membrane-bound lytic murein transglycosylase D [Sphingobacterium psychroaquaticum]